MGSHHILIRNSETPCEGNAFKERKKKEITIGRCPMRVPV
jgi:hypothetical protein